MAEAIPDRIDTAAHRHGALPANASTRSNPNPASTH